MRSDVDVSLSKAWERIRELESEVDRLRADLEVAESRKSGVIRGMASVVDAAVALADELDIPWSAKQGDLTRDLYHCVRVYKDGKL